MHVATLGGVISPKQYASGSVDEEASIDLNPIAPIRFIILHVGIKLDNISVGSIELDVNGGAVCGTYTDDATSGIPHYFNAQVYVPIQQGDTVTINSFGASGSFIISGVYWSAGE